MKTVGTILWQWLNVPRRPTIRDIWCTYPKIVYVTSYCVIREVYLIYIMRHRRNLDNLIYECLNLCDIKMALYLCILFYSILLHVIGPDGRAV
jgi:hypothetical protein